MPRAVAPKMIAATTSVNVRLEKRVSTNDLSLSTVGLPSRRDPTLRTLSSLSAHPRSGLSRLVLVHHIHSVRRSVLRSPTPRGCRRAARGRARLPQHDSD